MKVIDYNPAERVPPIMEKDIESKIIISITNIDNTPHDDNYFNYVKRDNFGLFHLHGIRIGDHGSSSSHVWSENANNGRTIIELLINEYEGFPPDWNITYFVAESESELIYLLNKYHINELMSNELLTYWKSLPKRSIE